MPDDAPPEWAMKCAKDLQIGLAEGAVGRRDIAQELAAIRAEGWRDAIEAQARHLEEVAAKFQSPEFGDATYNGNLVGYEMLRQAKRCCALADPGPKEPR